MIRNGEFPWKSIFLHCIFGFALRLGLPRKKLVVKELAPI